MRKLKLFALGAALCALLTACAVQIGPAAQLAPAETQPAQDAQRPAYTEPAEEKPAREIPVEEAPGICTLPEAPDVPTVIISTDVEDGFFDEVCSYSLEIPEIEDSDDPALKKLEDYFDTFENSLETYCGTTVYNTAQERSTVANVTGTFTAAQDAERLTVHYTLTETYGDQPDAAVERTRTLVFDVTTGELVEDSAG